MPFDLGDLVPLSVTVKDADGAPTNATTAALTIELPDGTTVTPTVTNPPAVTGTYAHDYLPVQVGRHAYRFVTTGPQAAFADVFDVRPAFPAYILSMADARKAVNLGTSTAYDEELRGYNEAVTAVVEDRTGMTVVRRTVVDYPKGVCGDELWLDHRPVISVTSIATTDGVTTWAPGDVDVHGDWGRLTLRSGRWRGDLAVTYVAGMAQIPANYLRAAAVLLEAQWQGKRGQTTLTTMPSGLEDSIAVPGLNHPVPNAALALLGPRPPMVA